MNILGKIIAVFVASYGLAAMIYTLFNKITYFINKFNKIVKRREKKQKIVKHNLCKTFLTNRKTYLIKFLNIDTIIKLEIVIWTTSLAIMIIVPKEYRNNFFCRIIVIGSLFFFFRGIGIFLIYRKENESSLDRINSYMIKLSIFILYSSLFLVGFLQKLSSNILFILAIFMLLIYSVCFLKYVIDDSKNFIFLMCNLIIIYIYDLIIFGITFGIFYISRNDIYELVKNANIILNSDTMQSYATIINKGLYNFYNYPNVLDTEDGFNSCVPLFQYLFGATFNITIIGFFISYTASKAFSKNENVDFNLLDQIKNKKFRVTVKKEDL